MRSFWGAKKPPCPVNAEDMKKKRKNKNKIDRIQSDSNSGFLIGCPLPYPLLHLAFLILYNGGCNSVYKKQKKTFFQDTIIFIK